MSVDLPVAIDSAAWDACVCVASSLLTAFVSSPPNPFPDSGEAAGAVGAVGPRR